MGTLAGILREGGTHRRLCAPSPGTACARAGRPVAALLGRAIAVSGLLAALHLSTSLYILVVYDEVLPAGRVADLATLTGLVVFLHMAFAALDLVRARMVCRAGGRIVAVLDRHVLEALRTEGNERSYALLDDVERIRRFLTSAGPCAVLDLLWAPAFLVAVFLLHPTLGLFACVAMLLLAGLAVAAEACQRGDEGGITRVRHGRYVLARDLLAARRHSGDRVPCSSTSLRWRMLSRSYSEATFSSADRLLCAGALAKGLRLVLQSAGFGLGALLVIEGLIGVGALFVSSLVLARTFACLDGVLQNWRGLVDAYRSYMRIMATSSVASACPLPACPVSDGCCEINRLQPVRS
jgi:ABC-type protease/lipase transport system fused ATPase/permease subunit